MDRKTKKEMREMERERERDREREREGRAESGNGLIAQGRTGIDYRNR